MEIKERLFVFQGRRAKRMDDFDLGRLVYRNEGEVDAAKRRSRRNRLLVLSFQYIPLAILLVFTNLVQSPMLVAIVVVVILALTILIMTEMSARDGVDVLPELYEGGILTKDVTMWYVVKLFFPYHHLTKVEVEGNFVFFRGQSRWGRWAVHKGDLGEEGIELFMRLMKGEQVLSEGPPKLFVYTHEGSPIEGGPPGPRD